MESVSSYNGIAFLSSGIFTKWILERQELAFGQAYITEKKKKFLFSTLKFESNIRAHVGENSKESFFLQRFLEKPQIKSKFVYSFKQLL